MTRFFYLSILFAFLTSCGYQLNDQAKQWIPYKAGDVLVFQSNNDKVDTIFITDVEQYFEGKNEIFKVNCNFIDHDLYSQKRVDTIYSWLMAITAWENGKAVLSINLNTRNARFAPFNAKPITKLDSLPRSSIDISNNNHKDVLTIEPDTNSLTDSAYLHDSLYVSKILWSKSGGLTRYELKNRKIIWTLKKKYSLNKNIAESGAGH